MGLLEGGGHASRSKRPVLPNHHSWRSQLEGEGPRLKPASRGCSGLGMLVLCCLWLLLGSAFVGCASEESAIRTSEILRF